MRFWKLLCLSFLLSLLVLFVPGFVGTVSASAHTLQMKTPSYCPPIEVWLYSGQEIVLSKVGADETLHISYGTTREYGIQIHWVHKLDGTVTTGDFWWSPGMSDTSSPIDGTGNSFINGDTTPMVQVDCGWDVSIRQAS